MKLPVRMNDHPPQTAATGLWTAGLIAILLTLASCPQQVEPPVVYPSRYITLSGSAAVTLNGNLRKTAMISAYSSPDIRPSTNLGYSGDSFSTIRNPAGGNEVNDLIYLGGGGFNPDGKWSLEIPLFSYTDNTFIAKRVNPVYFWVRSTAYGDEGVVIPYDITVYDKDIAGINLGLINLPGIYVNLSIGNVTVNDKNPYMVFYRLYRVKPGTTKKIDLLSHYIDTNLYKTTPADCVPVTGGNLSFDMGPVADDDTIGFSLDIYSWWGERDPDGSYEREWLVRDLKTGGNITINVGDIHL